MRWRNATDGEDDCHLSPHEFGCQRWQSINMIVGPAVLNRDVPSFDVAALLETLSQRIK